MKKAITHKDITLVFGILVALVIVFTLWVRSPQVETSRLLNLPAAPEPPSASTIIKTSLEFVF